MDASAILLLAGSSTRFDSPQYKQVYLLKNKPVFSYALDTLSKNKEIKQLIVVVNKNIEGDVNKYIKENNISAEIILGGSTRQESVQNGLEKCKEKLVLIHDGARPLIDDEIINDVLMAALECGASTAFIPETDTVVIKNNDQKIETQLNRDVVAKIQTPQAFKLDLILKAHKNAHDLEATDDCSLVKKLGQDVKLVLGNKKYTKITTLEDVQFLEGFLKWSNIKLVILSKEQSLA